MGEDDEEYIHNPKNSHVSGDEESESEAFDSPQLDRSRKGKQKAALGPPITRDDRMEELSDAHRSIIEGFIYDAKTLEEQIRNQKGSAKKPYFTEAQFREMILRWTLTLDDMKSIPGIDSERVQQCGKQFVQLIRQHQGFYKEAMNENRDIDRAHELAIELSSGSEDEMEFEGSDIDEDDPTQGSSSKYFNSGRVNDFNAKMNQFKSPTQRAPREPAPAKKTFRKGARGRGNSSKRRGGGGRKSNGSASGSGTTYSRASTTTGGVRKRKASGGGRQASMTNASRGGTAKAGSIMSQFTMRAVAGAGGGGPSMMPT